MNDKSSADRLMLHANAANLLICHNSIYQQISSAEINKNAARRERKKKERMLAKKIKQYRISAHDNF